MTDESFVKTAEVQDLLNRASGLHLEAGDPRVKAIVRDLLEAVMTVIAKYDVTEDEFWNAVKFLQDGAPTYGLIVAGTGLEHFLDLYLDAKDEAAGRKGGTPRTVEGPLYVTGAPLEEGDVNLTVDPEDVGTLHQSGVIRGVDGEPVKDAILHVWQADSHGYYSHFDPTGEQTPFNNRRRIKVGPDGAYAFHSKMPRGYSIPPGSAPDILVQAIGRHGNRPAHVHFFVEAPGYRALTTQINFGDDPHAHDDFAFATREGLLPIPRREGDDAYIEFDFVLQKAADSADEALSQRFRVAA